MKRIALLLGAAMLATSVTALAAAGSFGSGTYGGRTSQGDRFAMVVTQSQMTSATYTARYKCQDLKTMKYHKLTFMFTLPSTLIKNQRIYRLYHLPHRDTVWLKAHLNQKQSTGWFAQAFAAKDKRTGHHVACGSYGKIHFTLTLK